METYGFSYDHIWNRLTVDQVELYTYLAHERERERREKLAELTAFKTIDFLAKSLEQ